MRKKTAADLRGSLLALMEAQDVLRSALRSYLEEKGVNPDKLEKRFCLPWGSLKKFLGGKRIILAPKRLTDLCGLVERPDLLELHLRHHEGIKCSYIPLVGESRETVLTFTRILEVFEKSGCKVQAFSQVFGPNASVVRQAMLGTKSAIESLRKPEVRQTIEQQLDQYGEDQRRQAVEAQTEAAAARSKELNALVERLLPIYKYRRNDMAEALGFHRGTVLKALKGEASEKVHQQLVKRARQLLQQKEAKNRRETDSVELASVPARPSMQDGLMQLGGETVNGVPHVLTPGSFHWIEEVALVELRETLVNQVRRTRLLLNIGAQCRDEGARRILREPLGPELQELVLAIQTFSAVHPNSLLAWFEAQRQVWETSPSATTAQRRKGK